MASYDAATCGRLHVRSGFRGSARLVLVLSVLGVVLYQLTVQHARLWLLLSVSSLLGFFPCSLFFRASLLLAVSCSSRAVSSLPSFRVSSAGPVVRSGGGCSRAALRNGPAHARAMGGKKPTRFKVAPHPQRPARRLAHHQAVLAFHSKEQKRAASPRTDT